MASLSIRLGDAFLIKTPPKGKHLYIAIARTTKTRHLFVSVNSRQPKSETVCILKPGPDVPDFIIHESVVNYRFARELTVKELAKLLPMGHRTHKGYCSRAVLQHIQAGGLASKRLKNRYKLALKDFLEM
ncbi:hypothetical protein D0962_13190 [Leptolyngbyaceae cyanobacterium CCMR0082]|uniref:Uncharacterized protein n=1 Tax=Adonisia turfae CCMR0082 TaxID=2304604 RepID=A0A6M0S5J5_9CYAN|nr:hypothetical protein [Adonisia turfae]NEZ63728.1 hypothetical protein [Adonisia turfae CCMR0082]